MFFLFFFCAMQMYRVVSLQFHFASDFKLSNISPGREMFEIFDAIYFMLWNQRWERCRAVDG